MYLTLRLLILPHSVAMAGAVHCDRRVFLLYTAQRRGGAQIEGEAPQAPPAGAARRAPPAGAPKADQPDGNGYL